jgi:hypothetical protein
MVRFSSRLSRNDAVGRPFPLTAALSLGRRSTVDRLGLVKPFGVCDRGRVEEAKAGSPLRSAPALHRFELHRSGLAEGTELGTLCTLDFESAKRLGASQA